jgi:hypothetical protein
VLVAFVLRRVEDDATQLPLLVFAHDATAASRANVTKSMTTYA